MRHMCSFCLTCPKKLSLYIIEVACISFQVIEKYNDFAFSDYARVGRSLILYEVGNREEAIAEMEDVSISLKGYPGTSLYIALLS